MPAPAPLLGVVLPVNTHRRTVPLVWIIAPPPLSLSGGDFKAAFDAFTDQARLNFQRACHAGVSFMDAQLGR